MVSGQLGLRYQYMVKFTILFTQGEVYFFHVGSPSSEFFFRAGKPESGFGVVGLKAKPTGPLFTFTIFPRSLR